MELNKNKIKSQVGRHLRKQNVMGYTHGQTVLETVSMVTLHFSGTF